MYTGTTRRYLKGVPGTKTSYSKPPKGKALMDLNIGL
jgi:hypothetical protein